MGIVVGLVRVPAAGSDRVVWDGLLVSAAQLLGEQFLDEDEGRDGDGDERDEQSLLGDQTDGQQSEDSQGDDLQLDDSKDGHQLLQDLLLATGLGHQGAHVSLDVIGDDLGQAAGGLGEVPVQVALLEEVGYVVDDEALDGVGTGLDSGNGLNVNVVGGGAASVLSLHDRDAGDQVDLGLVKELLGFAENLQGTIRDTNGKWGGRQKVTGCARSAVVRRAEHIIQENDRLIQSVSIGEHS